MQTMAPQMSVLEDSTRSEENSDFMEIPVVTPQSPPSSQLSSSEPNAIPVLGQDTDIVPVRDSVPTSRSPSRVRRPTDRLTH